MHKYRCNEIFERKIGKENVWENLITTDDKKARENNY